VRERRKKRRRKVLPKIQPQIARPESADSNMADPAASRAAVRDILNQLFGGEAKEIVQQLAESHQLTPEEIRRMKEIYGKRPRKKR
jgi:predicted transcriptional regulator